MKRSGRTLLLLLPLLGCCPTFVRGATYFLAVDVPTTLGTTTYQPGQVLLNDNGTYALALDFGGGIALRSLHRGLDGVWLVSVPEPTTLGATLFQPNDVISYDGVNVSRLLDGGASGIPSNVQIDALFVAGGTLVMSFDIPTRIGPAEFSPSDLVSYSFSLGKFELYWDAEGAGVPASANLVGADVDAGGALVLSFDIPVNLGGTDYLPGQLVRWDAGTSFSSYFLDGAWPPGSQLRDFSLSKPAGVVPDAGGVPGTPLTVTRNLTNGDISLKWGGSCAGSDSDYEVYEGKAGVYYSHTLKFCSTGGATTETFPDPGGDLYFLVVPRNGYGVEGSYGRRSSGAERPQGVLACLPQAILATCP